MDDIYDNYGTLEECTLLAEAIKRWNHQAIDCLPEYLKDFYLKLLKTCEEIEEELELIEKYRCYIFNMNWSKGASTVESYMKENDTNAKVACKKLREIVEKAWKDLNKESLNLTKVPRPIFERVVNFSRSMEEIYRYIDMYTNSETTMKDNVSLLLIEPLPI